MGEIGNSGAKKRLVWGGSSCSKNFLLLSGFNLIVNFISYFYSTTPLYCLLLSCLMADKRESLSFLVVVVEALALALFIYFELSNWPIKHRKIIQVTQSCYHQWINTQNWETWLISIRYICPDFCPSILVL